MEEIQPKTTKEVQESNQELNNGSPNTPSKISRFEDMIFLPKFPPNLKSVFKPQNHPPNN